MAVTLIDSQGQKNPIFDHFDANEVLIGPDHNISSMQIDVYLNYGGQCRCFYSHIFGYNQTDTEHFVFDNEEEKTGMTKACELLNGEISEVLKGKDVTQLKKMAEMLRTWKTEKEQEQTMQSQNLNESKTPESTQNQPANEPLKIGENAIRGALEALHFSYGPTVNKESPFKAVYHQLKQKKYDCRNESKLPKLLFTIFNGGKEFASKVKFSRFYLILELSQFEKESPDALEIYMKIT